MRPLITINLKLYPEAVGRKTVPLAKEKPLILINFKLYPEAVGRKAVKLAKEIASVKSRKYTLAIAPSLLELEHVCNSAKIPVFAQHVDPEGGAHTGSISAKEAKKLGAAGTMLNHSEHKIPFSVLKRTIQVCRKQKLITVVCASSLGEVRKVSSLHPDYLAYEPPELIGGNVSVTRAKAEIVVQAVKAVRKLSPATKVLCGAGIHNSKDIAKALALGTEGVLIGHAVPKSIHPQKFLEKMVQ